MPTYTHPRSGATIEGLRLPAGSIIREDDMYDSTRGVWESAGPIAGLTIEPRCAVTWVRQTPLSENAQALLRYLNLRGGDPFGCISDRYGILYVIPDPTFNWDGRICIESKRVTHPECVQELVDYGYLALGEHSASNCQSGGATVPEGHKNWVYTLTDEGKREGARLLALEGEADELFPA